MGLGGGEWVGRVATEGVSGEMCPLLREGLCGLALPIHTPIRGSI